METLESFPKSHEGLARKTIGGNIMKKLIAMLLALVMVLGLAACGGSSAPAATHTKMQ